MKRLILLLPILITLLIPWTHKLIYNNIQWAWPGNDSGGTHFLAIVLPLIGFGITWLLIDKTDLK